jgi:hypothetical protein
MGLFQTFKSFNRSAPFKPFNSIQVGSTFNGSMFTSEGDFGFLRIPEASKDKTGLRCNSPPQACLMWIPRIRTLSGFDCCLGHLQRDAVWQ